MRACRTLLSTVAVVATLQGAAAQVDGLPWNAGVPISTPPPARPPQCQALFAIRGELQKDRTALQAARSNRADAAVACKLIHKYLATLAELLKMSDAHGTSCGLQPVFGTQVQRDQAGLRRIGLRACDAADDERRMFKLHPDRGPEPWWLYETR